MNNTPDGNRSLRNAATEREDEFYTQLTDIEKELRHYRDHFRGKVVYCNCDDPRESGFFHYFSHNFEYLGLKKLITTCYKSHSRDLFSQNESQRAVYLEYLGDRDGNRVPDPEEIEVKYLEGDGDFRSQECIKLLKEADIVVTNPPFSLFREYVEQLIEYKKNFLIIGSQNALSYKDIFTLIKNNHIWCGYKAGNMEFRVPQHYMARETRYWVDNNGDKWRSMGNICWFTNLDVEVRHQDIILYKRYSQEEYRTYDNYPAIEVSKVRDIPKDYRGNMGVPITFINKYNPEQFDILGIDRVLVEEESGIVSRFRIDNRELYARVVIKNKRL